MELSSITFLELSQLFSHGEEAVIHIDGSIRHHLVRISPAADKGYMPSVEQTLTLLGKAAELESLYDETGEDFTPEGKQRLADLFGMRTVFVVVIIDKDGYAEPEILSDTRKEFTPSSISKY